MDSFDMIDSSMKQIVTKPTRGKNILDVILTNVHHEYFTLKIIPPFAPDDSCKGVPSDHEGVIVHPKVSEVRRPMEVKIKTKIRPLPPSKMNIFGSILASQSWEF